MITIGRLLAAGVGLLIGSSSAFGGSLTVNLSPLEQTVKHGELPLFEARIRATEPTRIMDVLRRNDLRINYARLKITGTANLDQLPIAIADPGPIGEADYVLLKPDSVLTFQHRGEPMLLSALPVGTYTVALQFHADWRGTSVMSNTVTLRVTK
jgi:hypothetical protein